MKKNILGLDLGTNSIGWALVEQDFENKEGKILGMGSRIIPMSQDVLDNFGGGKPTITQTASRTGYRGVRRLRERHLLRRERLHRVLHLLGFLPNHYDEQIDFTKRFGKFINQADPKLAFDKEFLFKDSFNEMLEDFKQYQPEFLKDKNGDNCLVPYDWTIYYLRKKALNQKIEKEELAWLILNFNQKRGYYQLRGEEEEENPNKLVEFHSLKIIDVVPDAETNKKGEIWYSLHLENGWVYRRSSKLSMDDWKRKVRDFIVTTDLNDDGSERLDKEGLVKRSFRAPSSDDWTLLKKKTEQDINQSDKTVGTYIYDNLLLNPKQKIKGKLVRTIERKFYKQELEQILKTQKVFHSELQNQDLLQDCVRELYRNNEQHQQMLEAKDFVHLFLNDIIFYQRPLKSQKSSISNCTLEFRKSKNENGEEVIHPLKVIAKSNPYYQEFRLLQWLQNLVIYTKENDENVTNEFLNISQDWEDLLTWLHSKKEIKQDQLIDYLLKKKLDVKSVPKAEKEKYRWNYVQDKDYPGNETRYLIQSRLDKVENSPKIFLTFENEMALWHIIYSVHDKIEYEKALKSFANKKGLEEGTFVEAFKKFPPFKSDYGSFSEKAIKKLLPLMRFGDLWNWENIDQYSKQRIEKIITGEYDENIKDRVREKAKHLNSENDFKALPLWLAQYVVYGRHSEASIAGKWNSVDDLKQHLDNFKQHSLRNPIVEQVITETLRVVKDIWQQFGKGAKDFISEIHIELGREMKNTADERKRITTMVTDKENTNLRIKALLAEMAFDKDVDNVRPYSPMQQEILKIYEEGVLNAEENIEEDILKISKTAQPSSTDLKRYKLWLEQKYRSPYTGQMIPLNKLFTPECEIEHIIPQSRYFDDSMSNKVICESAVNKLKDNQIGLAFIKNHHGEVVDCGLGKQVKILEVSDYEDFVKQNYNKNRGKRNKLLLEDIPEKMIERQLNDTRYISKYITQLLSNIVRDDKSGSKDDGVNSKNIVPGNGKITTRLKQDWGLNDVWNDLVLPRFERMNALTNSTEFTAWNENHQKFLPTVPIVLSKGFSKKRIDHRHHAMDALVIACATRDHVNLLNNESSKSDTKRYDLNRKLRKYEKVAYDDPKTGERIEREAPKDFIKPWATFTEDTRTSLENIVISFKQNLRVINKATNYYEKIENGKKVNVEQKGINWAVRKSLHTPMPYGKKMYNFSVLSIADNFGKIELIVDDKVRTKCINILSKYKNISEANKGTKDKLKKYLSIFDAYKKNLNQIALLNLKKEIDVDESNKLENKLKEFTSQLDYFKEYLVLNQDYYALQKTVFNIKVDKFRRRQSISELSNRGQGGLRTTEDAIKFIDKVADVEIRESLLKHLVECKNNIDKAFSSEGIETFNSKRNFPVFKLPIAESGSGRFAVGENIATRHKWVEADKGTNLFFGIYIDKSGKRSYETIPLNIVIERQKQGLKPVPETNEKGNQLLFTLSPNDLVYVIDTNDIFNEQKIDTIRIYKMVSSTGGECHFVPYYHATSIQKNECGTNNKSERVMQFFNENNLVGNDKKSLMIKENCIKLNVDRLGNISKA